MKEQNTQNFEFDKLRERVAESEVIVIVGNPEDSIDPSNPWDWSCGHNVLIKCYVSNCDIDAFSRYIAYLREIYTIIFKLREGKPTIVRAIDAYNPSASGRSAAVPSQAGFNVGSLSDIC